MTSSIDRILEEIPKLRGFARYLAREPDQADDLVQETLMRALGALGSIDPSLNLRGWLFTILLNVLRSERRRRRRSPVVPALGELPDPPHSGGQYEAATLAELGRAVRRLPVALREVLILCGLEGFDYQEAAGILGVPIGTVRSRLSRARAALRESGMG